MASKLWRPLRIILLLLLLLLPMSASWTAAEDDASVARSAFPMDGDVAWVVQASDLHISAYHPDRADDLVRLLGPALRAIRPDLLIVTGDITDAKNRKKTTSRQDEDEWITYKKTIDAIVEKSGIDKRRIFDIRGNNDTYGVPYRGSKLDFFSTYSVSSQLDRLSTINSILLQGDRNYLFLGIDDTMSVGIRYPSNLFGNPTDKRIEAVNSELQYWTSHSNVPITKVVFGHFPMSFTSSSEAGQRYENVFARQSIAAYLCGHLHAKVSKHLWRYHQMKTEERSSSFWEWELGDWKDSRLMRILAIDRGTVSFIDHELKQPFETSILITYPTDSRNMNILELESKNGLLRNDISVLVFSEEPILNVSARVFDSHNEFKIVEEMPLQHASSSSAYKPLFHAKWNAENYRSASPTRYWLQVFVLDSHGKKILSERRPFSVEGKIAIPQRPWLNRLMLEVEWEGMYKVLLWSNLAFTFFLLFIPKMLYHAFKRSPSYQRWALSILSSPVQQRNAWFLLVWFLVEGSSSKLFWFSLTLYVIWIAQMPWFLGHATSENGEIGQMYLSGWSMPSSGASQTNFRPNNPDVMVITLPFLYLVVVPVVVLAYGLYAERSAAYLRHHSRAQTSVNRADTAGESASFVSASPSPGPLMKLSYKKFKLMLIKFCGGCTRRIILLACLITATIHLKLSSMLMSAYGSTPVVLSPPLTWMPLLLLSVAAYCTMPPVDYYNIERRSVNS